MRINEALEQFVLQLQADGRSVHTIKQYRRHIGLLTAWLAPRDDSERIDHQVLARFLASPGVKARADGGPRKASSANALRGSLKVFFGYLAAAGILGRDPAKLIRRAKCGSAPPKTLSEPDQAQLLATVGQATDEEGRRDHTLFALMLKTGIRVGSAVALDVEDLDLARGELSLRSAKGDRAERVFMPSDLVDQLRAWLGDRNAGPVFQGGSGKRITTRHVGRRLAQWMTRAGIDRSASPHALRHTYATTLYQRTGDILLVKDALCHRSIASTTIYARVSPERLRSAVGG